ncbi:MAG TPA: hypothetical protein VKU38_04780 [Ktedonobacteraceae bacterium]|nr:hypothetical protein [Ktedonobacteraceae bacterium]
MNPTVAGYLGFVVAALIIIWAVFEIGRRYTRRKGIDAKALDTWVKLDSTHTNGSEELPPIDDDDTNNDGDQEGISESDLHTRAQQNGHYSESKKPL